MTYLPLLVAASGILCVSAVISFALARRYGGRFALMMPVLAFLAMTGIMWQSDSGEARDRLSLVMWSLAAASPAVLGCLVGILLARRPRL